ncbi:MAG: methyl-accepting chemotaxis protein [Geobacter sp.]|nr:methyl-accepting chemotaxis protein [Geobacter sp.]
MFRKQLSSLRSTFIFMTCFGLLMGAVFPFYSWMFFGKAAFNPLYAVGCLTAGFLVGTFCYYVIKQVLKLYLERQWEALGRIAGAEACLAEFGMGKDELRTLMECHDALISRVLSMVDNVTSVTGAITPLYRQLTEASRGMVSGNEHQVAEVRKSLSAVEAMNAAFAGILSEVEEIATRTEKRASISSEMSATTDAIAANMNQYGETVMETSASIEEMVASLKETAGNVEGLAASTEQTSSSIGQITAAIASVRDYAQKTADSSEKVRSQAQEGMKAMDATLKTMGEIEETSRESFDAINRLAAHSAKVGEFLDIIQEVVQQTNLLSLNASIIAAQAGERGKAFSVVSGEVRQLADRTAASTKEISELVNNIRTETVAVQRAVAKERERVENGVKITNTAGEALRKIEESAGEASEMVRRIATATEEQASGSRLISEEAEKNLARVNHVTRAVQEQEKGTTLIVATLERMRQLAQKITTSIQELARGNHHYLQSVHEDNEKVQGLRATSLEQMKTGEGVAAFVRETGGLIENNTESSRQIMEDIASIAELTARLEQEMAAFRVQS